MFGSRTEAQTHPQDLVTVFFGANDAALPDRTAFKQHIPLPEYRQNLTEIVTKLRAARFRHIVLISPPPVSEPHRIAYARAVYGVELKQSERTLEAAGSYASSCVSLAQELGPDVIYVDLWTGFQTVQDWQETLLNDGLHLTAAGNVCFFSSSYPFPHL